MFDTLQLFMWFMCFAGPTCFICLYAYLGGMASVFSIGELFLDFLNVPVVCCIRFVMSICFICFSAAHVF